MLYSKANVSQYAKVNCDDGDPADSLSFNAYLDKIANPSQEVGEFVQRSLITDRSSDTEEANQCLSW